VPREPDSTVDAQLEEALLRVVALAVGATIRAGAASDPVLTATQVRTLTVLGAAPQGLTLTEVAAALAASAPSASRLCSRLHGLGLLDREHGPNNTVLLSRTEHGQDVLDRVNRARVAELRAALNSVPAARQQQTRTALVDLGVAITDSAPLS